MVANLPVAQAQNCMDVLARMYELAYPVLGSNETTANTWRRGAKRIWDEALAGADAAEAQSPLTYIAAPADTVRSALDPAVFIKNALQGLVTGLQSELDNDIAGFLGDNDIRAHYYFGDLFYQVTGRRLSPATVVFPPVQTIIAGDRGASAWTFDAASVPLDVTKYGGTQLELVADTLIGAADCVVTLTCRSWDGTTYTSVQEQVTMPQASASGTAVAIGDSGDLYVDVTAISATGGTSGDGLSVRSKLVRSIAAIIN